MPGPDGGEKNALPARECSRSANFAFRDQQDILRNRFFGGLKIKYYVFAITFEAMIALSGTSADDRAGTDDTCVDISTETNCDTDDFAGPQESYTVSVGFDF